MSKLTKYFDSKTNVLVVPSQFFHSKIKSEQNYTEWVAKLMNTAHDAGRTAALQKTNALLADMLAICEAFKATQKTI